MNINTQLSIETESVDVLRHGELVNHQHGRARFIGSTDLALSKEGWQQMQNAVAARRSEWNLVISSPLQRCSDFAEVLASSLQVPCQIMTDLREYHFGVWEGQFVDGIAKYQAENLQRFWQDPIKHAPVGAESMAEFKTRVISAWEKISRYEGFNRILLITHAGVMRLIYSHINQLALSNFLDYQPAYAEFLHISNRIDDNLKQPSRLKRRDASCVR